MENLWVNIVTSLFVLVMLISYQPYWDKALFNYSLNEIPVIQEKLAGSGVCPVYTPAINWWIFWADWGLKIATYGPTIVSFMFGLAQRPRACCYAIFQSFVVCLINTSKTAYAEARPWWDNYLICPYSCSTQFGNPSGHSVNSMAACMFVYLDYYTSRQRKNIPENSWFASEWISRALFVVALIYPWCVGYARVVMGMHSYNQILYGFALGAWLAFSFHFILRDAVMAHLTALCQNKVFTDEESRRNMLCALIMVTFGFLFFVQIIQYIPYWINYLPPGSWQPQQNWLFNISQPPCNVTNYSHSFFAISIIWSGSSAIGPGAYFGLIIESYFYGGTSAFREPEAGKGVGPQIGYTLARTAIGTALIYVGFCCGYGMELNVGQAGQPLHDWWILFNSLLRRFGEPFFPFAFADVISKACKLLKEPDPEDGHITFENSGKKEVMLNKTSDNDTSIRSDPGTNL